MNVPRPKLFAGLLLIFFFAQCLWLVHVGLRSELGCYPEGAMQRQGRVAEGLAQWKSGRIAGIVVGHENSHQQVGDHYHSPVWYLVASAPVVFWPASLNIAANDPAANPGYEKTWLWLTRIPFLAFGIFLGASLWYVAHRLYGNTGGFIALILYCFSPGIIQNSSALCWNSEMGAAWGFFGAVFTAIAVAHTLYAPREVVLWNLRRIVLLGISLALAIGSQFSLAVLIPLTLGFLLYLAPERRRAAGVIWAAASAFSGLLLAMGYFFRLPTMWRSLSSAKLIDVSATAFKISANYRSAATQIIKACPLLLILFPATLLAYALWRRARYFGNTAPLLVVTLCVGLALAAPNYPGQGFLLVSLPFFFCFVAGVLSDLIETQSGALVRSVVTALLAAYGLWNVVGLARL